MGDRFYPPDYEPRRTGRRYREPGCMVRIMLPMSIRCNTCENRMCRGTKFNARKQEIPGETYMGIQIFRFNFKCSRCSAELTMRTDPQTADFIVGPEATRLNAEDEAAHEMIQPLQNLAL
ncbi:hypothetical protein MKW94_014229 [Papaver nudicaule]|uniref:Uncharacterized protein n=1 Tax=Papaver nudicaule TaxID=74823 RepID=A0AA41UYE3_PAPNU|nr:hypothetical protein [Papaver nudicaule]